MATTVQEGIEKLRQASRVFRQIAAGPIPRDLNAQDSQTASQYNNWLQQAAAESDAVAELLEKTKEMQAMSSGFNEQLLQLQQKMLNENRQFTFISNVMKTRHDNIKTAINNVR